MKLYLVFNKNELNLLYRYALSLSAREDIAYDLVQSALERFLNGPASNVEKPLAYLKVTIRNLYFDLERHNKVVPMISAESDEVAHIEPIDESSMDDLLISQQQVQYLVKVLNSEENEMLYLWAVEEYTVDEIAKIYRKSKGTVLSRLHRLKKRIRKYAANSDIYDKHTA